MKIVINHLAKMEGHASFIGALKDGNIKQAKVITEEGVRLVEGCLKGKSLYDAHVITMRICGICPIVHNLTAIKAMEKILGVKVSQQTVKLRKLMELAQLIHSHAMHLYFLSLPDFLNFNDTLRMIKKYPKEAQIALRLREFGNLLNETIGGRAIHPLNNWIGGFKVLPKTSDLNKITSGAAAALGDAVSLAQFFAKLEYPKFERKTEFVSLYSPKEYAIYDGGIITSSHKRYTIEKFYRTLNEVEEKGAMAKRALWQNAHFMVGALARISNHGHQLNPEAKKIWLKKIGPKLSFNTFHNVLAQAVEVVHCLEEVQKIVKSIKLKVESPIKYKIKAGKAVASVEAPRGILFHYYEINSQGRIVRANIITPTVMFLGNLEDDLSALLPKVKAMSESQRRLKIKQMIRAYDPCISCATH